MGDPTADYFELRFGSWLTSILAHLCYIHLVKLLDPKLDIVLKLLLQRELVLLRSMIETVVNLPAPIEDLVILNPELPKDLAGDKGIVLDVRVSLANRANVDIEMQSELPAGVRSSFSSIGPRSIRGSCNGVTATRN